MLDKVLIKHLDEQDVLEDRINEDIEDLLKNLDFDLLVKDSDSVLLDLVSDLFDVLKEKYYHIASENGITLAKNIIDDGDIVIQDTKDPGLNK